MSAAFKCLAAMVLACALVSPASAQLLEQKCLSAAMEMTIANRSQYLNEAGLQRLCARSRPQR
jgi:hypothetical protein